MALSLLTDSPRGSPSIWIDETPGSCLIFACQKAGLGFPFTGQLNRNTPEEVRASVRMAEQLVKATSIVAVWILLAIAASAQMEPTKPSPEVKKLEVLTGSWTLEG